MKKPLLAVGILFLSIFLVLSACQPVSYYLQKVCKVYGRVTDGTFPMESCEVSIIGTQYSELSNSRGDYELELAEGTWVIACNYKPLGTTNPWKSGSATVTVGPNNPRVQLDFIMSAADWIGTWKVADTDPAIAGDMGLQVGANEEVFFYVNVYDRSTGLLSYGLYTWVAVVTDSQVVVPKVPGMWVADESGNFIPAGDDVTSRTLQLFDSAGLGDAGNIFFPYSVSGDKMTIKLLVGNSFQNHVFVRSSP